MVRKFLGAGALLVGMAAGPLFAQGQSFAEHSAPMQVILEPAHVEHLRSVMAGESEHVGHLRELMGEADAACERAPRPLPVLVYEGRVSDDPERIKTTEHLRDMSSLICMTYAFQITGEAKYAEAAVRYARAWAETYRPTGNDVNDVKLLPLVYALGVLRDRMDDATRQTLSRWTSELDARNLEALKTPRAGNRPAKRLHMLAVSAKVRGDAELKARLRTLFLEHIERTLLPDGRSFDLDHRDALHYHMSTLEPLLKVALVVDPVLMDLETPAGASLRKSLDYVLPYARGEKVHREWVDTKVDLDRRRAAAGDPFYQPGKPWPRGNGAQAFAIAALIDPQYRTLAVELAGEAGSDDQAFPLDCLVYAPETSGR